MSAALVRVVGAGVVGLTSALRLQAAGFRVSVWARERTPHTTSDVAAALWYPYLVDEDPLVERWSLAALAQLLQDARDPASGVVVREGIEWLAEAGARPFWAGAVPLYRAARVEERPHSHPHSVVFAVPVAEMGVHLAWLERRLLAGGGSIEVRDLASLDEAFEDAATVVNATGLGAGELAGDPRLSPVRGQVLRVEQVGLERFVLHDEPGKPPAYVIPRSRDIVLGGTAEPGEHSLIPDATAIAGIRARCEALEPRLRDARELSRAAGLRPHRGTVRLQRERRPGGTVVHCYGHGGAGLTLAWGCADEVLEQVQSN